MEVKKITPEMSAKLREPLPKEAISQHPTKSFLSTIKAIYMVERLNNVFGIGSWRLKNTVIDSTTKMVIIHAILYVPEYGIELESFGGNDNADNGDAYKGASTDALSKICSFLEIGMDVYKGFRDPIKADAKPVVAKAIAPVAKSKPVFDETHPNFSVAKTMLSDGTTTIEDIQKKYTLTQYIIDKLITK